MDYTWPAGDRNNVKVLKSGTTIDSSGVVRAHAAYKVINKEQLSHGKISTKRFRFDTSSHLNFDKAPSAAKHLLLTQNKRSSPPPHYCPSPCHLPPPPCHCPSPGHLPSLPRHLATARHRATFRCRLLARHLTTFRCRLATASKRVSRCLDSCCCVIANLPSSLPSVSRHCAFPCCPDLSPRHCIAAEICCCCVAE
ncbi:hypothetical protein Salat_2428200 [Sesamum alatum]|uniref:Uncharacterized protein n=1 Tax=Sesamum alatum TaxID=300844 RepID=A0AAE2CFF4_9LAMI|nr:hypothetical protein Salat_2428200 [Sesamum alatum]